MKKYMTIKNDINHTKFVCVVNIICYTTYALEYHCLDVKDLIVNYVIAHDIVQQAIAHVDKKQQQDHVFNDWFFTPTVSIAVVVVDFVEMIMKNKFFRDIQIFTTIYCTWIHHCLQHSSHTRLEVDIWDTMY